MSAALHSVIAALGANVRIAPEADPVVVDVEHDSRRVGPATLFACIRGRTSDGHDHAADAVAGGATALLVERPLDLGVPEIVVDEVRAAVGPAASVVHGEPSRALAVVGVTGTNGKTTTVHLVGEILRTLGRRCTEIGTLTGARTTPEAPELQRLLAEARDRGDEIVAMEVSSHALDQRRVDGTRFRVVAFTNLGIDHLDYHGTMEEYERVKASLFRADRADRAVVDARSAAGARIADGAEPELTAIRDDDVEMLALGPTSSRFRWRDSVVELPLGGEFNVANAVVAAEIAVGLGHEPAEIAEALAAVSPVPGRFETVDEGQSFTVVVDYAHTPDGLEAVLDAARRVTDRQLMVVFGAGGDRDRGKRPRMGDVARRLADLVVVTSDNPRGEDPDAIISAIVSGMDTPADLVEPDRRAAIRHALAGARGGDVVVIAGKGHEATQTIGDDVVPFDDREVAREELRRLGGRAS